MTPQEARAYFIDSNERIISVAKDENRYNYETQQIEDVSMRRDVEAQNWAIKTLRYNPIVLQEHDAEPRTLRAILDTATDEIYICRLTRQGAELLGMTIEDRSDDEYSMEQINAVKAKSRNSGAWKDFPIEMAKKSVVRRLCKQITLDFSDKEQADSFSGADEFIDDPKEQAAKDVSENANQQSFEDEVVVEVDPNEIEGQMSMEFGE